MYIDYNT